MSEWLIGLAFSQLALSLWSMPSGIACDHSAEILS